jgi:hypothetical protein
LGRDDENARVLKRAAFFAGMAERLASSLPAIQEHSEFRADSPVLMAKAYFLLSDAYKPFRNNAESLTDEYKRAAISALAVMVVRPFSPLQADNVESMTAYLANPIMALACANAWAAQRNLFAHYPFDYLKRFYLTLDSVRLPSLDHFVGRVNEGESWREIEGVGLSWQEIVLVDDWVLKIHMLCNQKR